MALHLVGETLNKTRSHYRSAAGRLVQLMRGIYVAADADAAIEDLLQRLRGAIEGIALPAAPAIADAARKIAAEMLDICRARLAEIA